ncbi:MAG: waaE [Acidobacteria bacterium]|jgi:glycosyltransferase involved in cell wall biosynthesis|nr:waaE [Acidobacteriota bacterium]
MEPISATLITYNEERNIAAALQSLAWADEIVVVDSGSKDATVEICRTFTDRIYARNWTGYADQKNYAVEKASHNWIFSLDADERLSAELQNEIKTLLRGGLEFAGYKIPRISYFMGRWIRHGEWYPDYQLRLFKRQNGKWQGGRVHESVKLDGQPGYLKGEIQHYLYNTLSDYLHRLDAYSSLAALDYRERGEGASAWKLLSHPLATFVKGYLAKGGFLDGTPGLMVALMGAISVYFKYAKRYEMQIISKNAPQRR